MLIGNGISAITYKIILYFIYIISNFSINNTLIRLIKLILIKQLYTNLRIPYKEHCVKLSNNLV